MTPEALFEKLADLADRVIADKRWQDQNDDLGVSVLGKDVFYRCSLDAEQQHGLDLRAGLTQQLAEFICL